jgi:hypothetical protein
MRKLFMGAAGIAAAAWVGATAPSQAVTFQLTQTQANLGSAPYGTLDVTQDVVNNELDFVLNTISPFQVIDTGSHFAFAFNLSVSGLAITNIADNSVVSFSQVAGSSFTNSPYGPFKYAIACSDPSPGATGCGTQLSFSVPVATLSQLLSFSADIRNTTTGATGATFGVPTPNPVPLPGAFLLMGTVLAGGGGYATLRRRRNPKGVPA